MTHLDYLNANYPMRRTKEQKAAFQKHVTESLQAKGITAKIEKTKDGKNENIVVGDPLTAKAVFTAHYDTPGRALFPNIMIPRNQALFWMYQFVPILVMVAIMFLVGIIAGVACILITGDIDERVALIAALLGYYIAFYFMFFAFSNKNNYNDNTSGVATLLSIIDKLSEEQLRETAFIFFDNEEKGKKGSKAYFADHKAEMASKLVINFDCVGHGNNIVFIAKPEAEKLAAYNVLCQSFPSANGFETAFYPKKGSQSNSDYLNFPCGVGCMACKKSKKGLLYTPYIHTKKDIVVDNANIEFLVDGATKFLGAC